MEDKIVQKGNVSYPTRNSAGLTNEAKIVQKGKPSHENDRYTGSLGSEKTIVQKGKATYSGRY